jgi:hypothetical protein
MRESNLGAIQERIRRRKEAEDAAAVVCADAAAPAGATKFFGAPTEEEDGDGEFELVDEMPTSIALPGAVILLVPPQDADNSTITVAHEEGLVTLVSDGGETFHLEDASGAVYSPGLGPFVSMKAPGLLLFFSEPLDACVALCFGEGPDTPEAALAWALVGACCKVELHRPKPKAAGYIEKSAAVLAAGIGKTAEYTTKGITRSASYIQGKTTAATEGTEKQISEKTSARVLMAATVTTKAAETTAAVVGGVVGTAVSVSSSVAGGLFKLAAGKVAERSDRKAAAAVEKAAAAGGTEEDARAAAAEKAQKAEKAQARQSAAAAVGAASVDAAVQLLAAMDHATTAVFSSGAQASSGLVTHKYCSSMGRAL